MTALAEILASRGARLSGSDVPDVFPTDAQLRRIGVELSEGFAADHLDPDVGLVIHSAAYDPGENPELLAARSRSIPTLSYPEALGALSQSRRSTAIAGVHGKTTTTALAGTLLAALGCEATVLAGSAVSSFGGRSCLVRGTSHFVAETCEYRRHFLHFHPSRIVLTSVEADHQDYYPDFEDILEAFVEFGLLLPRGGEFIYCSDDRGACAAADRIAAVRPDLRMIPYGRSAPGPFRMTGYKAGDGEASFTLSGFQEGFRLHVPGEHVALDATAAIIVSLAILGEEREGPTPSGNDVERIRDALASFVGSTRRSELVGEAAGILFMDDYGHHPTAIRKTLAGIRAFRPSRRLVVDFMPHTVSRTSALLAEFAESLDEADEVILHRVYPSAREAADTGSLGRRLYELVSARRPSVRYFDDPMDAFGPLRTSLKPGDLFLTMGAGDNFHLGRALFDSFQERSEHQ